MLVLHDKSECSDTFAMAFSFSPGFRGLPACCSEGGQVAQYVKVLCFLVCLSCRAQCSTWVALSNKYAVELQASRHVHSLQEVAVELGACNAIIIAPSRDGRHRVLPLCGASHLMFPPYHGWQVSRYALKHATLSILC